MINGTAEKLRFGGFSGIEYINNEIWVISDRAKKADIEEDESSYVFILDTNYNFQHSFKFYDVKNAESIRFDKLTKNYFYAFEEKLETGVGYVDSYSKEPHKIITEKINLLNRGIEALTFSKDSSLWVAFESGTNPKCEGMTTTPFYKIPFDKQKFTYNDSLKIIYEYPIDRCECLNYDPNIHQDFDGNLGNGVTEILAFPNDPNKMLVLERCYNKKIVSAIYLAEISVSSKSIQKTKIFDFNDAKNFSKTNFRPDNLEGMTWGSNNKGENLIYLITDNNFSKAQNSQLIKLVIRK